MTLPNVNLNLLEQPTLDKVQAKALDHPPRILLLYGSTGACGSNIDILNLHTECGDTNDIGNQTD